MQEPLPPARKRRRQRFGPLFPAANSPRQADPALAKPSTTSDATGLAQAPARPASSISPEKRRRLSEPECIRPTSSSDHPTIPAGDISLPNGAASPRLTTNVPCRWPSSRSIDAYERLNFIAEGSYGRVFRARELATGEIYALKKLKDTGGRDGFPATALRELSALFAVQHENVVGLKEVVVGATLSDVYLVLEYATHDMQSALSRQRRPFAASEAKALLQQLLRGIAHLHARGLLHRDLKPANVLLAHGGVLKVCDFGLARRPGPNLTPGPATLWYRAPELLLADPAYGAPIDVWAAGCIFAELVTRKPLFPGQGELDQIALIGKLLGRPTPERWPGLSDLPNASRILFPGGDRNELRARFADSAGLSPAGANLLERMLTYDPEQRITAEQALRHAYFSEMPPPKDWALIQTFPDDRRG